MMPIITFIMGEGPCLMHLLPPLPPPHTLAPYLTLKSVENHPPHLPPHVPIHEKGE